MSHLHLRNSSHFGIAAIIANDSHRAADPMIHAKGDIALQ